MFILESLGISLLSISLVFLVLAFIFALIKLLSVILQKLGNNNDKTVNTSTKVDTVSNMIENTQDNTFSSGDVKLFNVDEKTAAMIMAIVSHESKIPLSELSFKSIRAID